MVLGADFVPKGTPGMRFLQVLDLTKQVNRLCHAMPFRILTCKPKLAALSY